MLYLNIRRNSRAPTRTCSSRFSSLGEPHSKNRPFRNFFLNLFICPTNSKLRWWNFKHVSLEKMIFVTSSIRVSLRIAYSAIKGCWSRLTRSSRLLKCVNVVALVSPDEILYGTTDFLSRFRNVDEIGQLLPMWGKPDCCDVTSVGVSPIDKRRHSGS